MEDCEAKLYTGGEKTHTHHTKSSWNPEPYMHDALSLREKKKQAMQGKLKVYAQCVYVFGFCDKKLWDKMFLQKLWKQV